MINVIDQDKCIGCGTCFKSCSLDVFRLDTDQSKVSPCMAACPAGTDIRGYNALVQQGKLEEAAQKLRQANPFPGITGRICFHPCEKECARNAVDGAVNICAPCAAITLLRFRAMSWSWAAATLPSMRRFPPSASEHRP